MNANKFNQVCVMTATIVDKDKIADFEEFVKEHTGARIKYIDEILTLPSLSENGEPIPETGKRNDVLFYVHDDDIHSFAIKRFELGIRWFEDVVNNQPYLYNQETIDAHYKWDK